MILREYLFIFQNRPKPVDPIDYETYVVKNKVLLHNDPQREMLTFPFDDIEIPVSVDFNNNSIIMGKSFQDYCLIQDFEADFP